MQEQHERDRAEPEPAASDFPRIGVARRRPDGAEPRERNGLGRRGHRAHLIAEEGARQGVWADWKHPDEKGNGGRGRLQSIRRPEVDGYLLREAFQSQLACLGMEKQLDEES